MPEPGRDAISLPVVESSQAGEARRFAADLTQRLGFAPVLQGKVALIVTELAHNLIRHAQGGELLIQRVEADGRAGIEILAIDRGPGMVDFHRCLADGFSTYGTPGNGLGSVTRQADSFDFYSTHPKGTVIAARVWETNQPTSQRPGAAFTLDLGAVCLPVAGEVECGDAWAVAHSAPARYTILVADGLGHGPEAAEASNLAVATFQRNPSLGPVEHLEAIHPALRATRGAAVAVAALDLDRGEIRFAGVGNIAGSVIAGDGRRRGLVSHNGTVGGNMRKVQEFVHPWSEESLLVLHSDGLATQWRLDDQPGLMMREPSVIAGVLYRDFSRGRDDVTVLVARRGRSDR